MGRAIISRRGALGDIGYKEYGVMIDTSNPNSETALTYLKDAVGITSGYNEWKGTNIFKNIKPCLLKDGVLQYYLNPSDFTKKEDGSNATITDINSGDVMIEIPKIGYKITTEGKYNYVYITDNPNAEGYCYRAHSLNKEGDCDKIYIGAYIGSVIASKIYSISNQIPSSSINLTTFRNYVTNKGTGYQILSFYPLTLLQCMFLIIYKNINSQAALGLGYTRTGNVKTNTGGTNLKGMCYGEHTGTQQMCFLGVEDLWGNLYQWVDGFYFDSARNIKTAFNNFNDTGSGYPYSKHSGLSSNIMSYLSVIQGTNESGFILKSVNASTSTYYADTAGLNAGNCVSLGGSGADNDSAGLFRLVADVPASATHNALGARIVFKHVVN